ncbi:uncharacterized protein BDZ99DRAFT_525027 [Mytilinidion resinicola]|uniref:Uncharacterized protein n=1 Tax=Mytilinidion resinicola TaxID=574789 RepID=A0A6A6Y923_9PEZI|nr:uncharacterized protein BDZ99DRAFT_525027 [Mytilinidion resinicola]KAF2805321.1 hypothetical protein BDZ99DRAFT_525027 [Mytilinidion resinicola]
MHGLTRTPITRSDPPRAQRACPSQRLRGVLQLGEPHARSCRSGSHPEPWALGAGGVASGSREKRRGRNFEAWELSTDLSPVTPSPLTPISDGAHHTAIKVWIAVHQTPPLMEVPPTVHGGVRGALRSQWLSQSQAASLCWRPCQGQGFWEA